MMKVTPFDKVFVSSVFESKKTAGLFYVDGIAFADGIPERCSFRSSRPLVSGVELQKPVFDLKTTVFNNSVSYFLVLV